MTIPHPPHCPPFSLTMKILPYVLLLLLLPQIQGCKNIKGKIFRRAGYIINIQPTPLHWTAQHPVGNDDILAGYGLTHRTIVGPSERRLTGFRAKNLFEAPEVKQIMVQIIGQIIKEKFASKVNKEVILKILSKKEDILIRLYRKEKKCVTKII